MRSFVVHFTLVFALAFGGAVAINYWVDPFDLNIAPGRAQPPVKRETGSHGRLHKAYALINLRPEVVALGASRTEAGLDMNHAGWAGTRDRRYNAAVTAANFRETWAFLQLAVATGHLKQVAIGLEFYSFNAFAPNRPDYEPQLMHGAPPRVLGVDPVKLRYYASFDGLVSSVNTLGSRSMVPHFQLDGSVNPAALAEAYHGSDGQSSAFLAVDREALQIYYLPPPRRRYSFVDDRGVSTLDIFRDMLDLSRREHIDLRLFISPAHARAMESIRMLGLEPAFEAWQRDLVRLADEEAARSGGTPFTIWDFSAPSALTTEAVPPDNPQGPRSRWFWESSHYRRELGDLVLDRIFDVHDAGRSLPPDFGVRLDRDMLPNYQATTRDARERYRREHVAELEPLVASMAQGR